MEILQGCRSFNLISLVCEGLFQYYVLRSTSNPWIIIIITLPFQSYGCRLSLMIIMKILDLSTYHRYMYLVHYLIIIYHDYIFSLHYDCHGNPIYIHWYLIILWLCYLLDVPTPSQRVPSPPHDKKNKPIYWNSSIQPITREALMGPSSKNIAANILNLWRSVWKQLV